MSQEYSVVWNGRGPLLPEREERWDTRYAQMPTFDLDEAEEPPKPRRHYNKTGRYRGVFSRTNPAAGQFRPKRERV